jgi:hypothetical protein
MSSLSILSPREESMISKLPYKSNPDLREFFNRDDTSNLDNSPIQ